MQMDVNSFDQLAREVFAPVYPVIASQVVQHTGITEGVCLDMGCGGGYLGLALARVTDLRFHFLDQSREMLEIVRANLAANGLENRGDVLEGNAESIPLPDRSVNLVISRGSLFFWDRVPAFREIYRVLAPGGMSYIGGGFGSPELKDEITRRMEARSGDNGQWREKVARNLGPQAPRAFEDELRCAGIPDFRVEQSEAAGLWIIVRK
ncbi:class I SAM-dependent methyltransferase [Pelobacter propionicus]|uniref:Methyltransferase type 11 n=1 Tax=Pelobacter propionicus (strain DSM 2379 / NBRC 103807 / OttBd1) TaxID=338966 RepID=A1AP14_PELPD|nr:class I SAM-dependent methyltransferase [Pelobacter propionicus]ABK99084.1 Methyltransferase type 11 [Pelobacter propionicus DSM 2379]